MFSSSNLGYHSNNRFDGFPPLMSDGRSIVANGKSEPLGHNALLQNTGITNNAQYRDYMIKNAKQIMMNDFRNSSNDTGFSEEGRFVDYLLASVSGKHAKHASYVPTNDRIVYKNSDLKDIYLSREQLDARREYPSLPSTHK
jgi:hypothetical protein